MNNKFLTAKNVAILGVLIAIVIVMQLFASAIPMLGVTLNLSLIPIAIAGILLGALGGTIVGFVCGLVVFITAAVMGQEPSTAFLFSASPVILTLMCIGKTTIAGFISGLINKPLSKKNIHLAAIACSVIIPIVNTGIYMLGMVLMKGSVAKFLGLASGSAGVVFTVVFGMIWLNFLLEIAVTVIFSPIIYRVIKALKI